MKILLRTHGTSADLNRQNSAAHHPKNPSTCTALTGTTKMVAPALILAARALHQDTYSTAGNPR